MTSVIPRSWYKVSLGEWCVIFLINAVLIFLLLPALQGRGNPHVETRTTAHRASIWISAAEEFEKQTGRSITSVEELESFVLSEDCHYCNETDVKLDWWGTPFRIWISENPNGFRSLNVQSARWNRTFEEADKTWTYYFPKMSAEHKHHLTLPTRNE